MDVYEIMMTPDAVDDLTEVRDYIADILHAPETALAYVRSVRKEIGSLSVLPARNMVIDEEPLRSRGIRRLLAKNFFVYYRIDEAEKRVYILNVIYARRDQLNALRDPDPEYVFFTHGAGDTRNSQAFLIHNGYTRMSFATWGMLTMQTDGKKWIVKQDIFPEMQKVAETYRYPR